MRRLWTFFQVWELHKIFGEKVVYSQKEGAEVWRGGGAEDGGCWTIIWEWIRRSSQRSSHIVCLSRCQPHCCTSLYVQSTSFLSVSVSVPELLTDPFHNMCICAQNWWTIHSQLLIQTLHQFGVHNWLRGFVFFGFSVLRILLCYGWFDVAVCHIHSGQFGVLMGTWRRWAAWPWGCWRATSTHYNQWPLWCWDLINYMWVWSYHSIF